MPVHCAPFFGGLVSAVYVSFAAMDLLFERWIVWLNKLTRPATALCVFGAGQATICAEVSRGRVGKRRGNKAHIQMPRGITGPSP